MLIGARQEREIDIYIYSMRESQSSFTYTVDLLDHS